MFTKRSLTTLHVWLGLTIGALWALQGLSGALLAFNRDIRAIGLAAAPDRSRLPLDQLFERASAAAGTHVATVETFSPQPSLLAVYYKVVNGQRRMLILDAVTGDILDRRDLQLVLPPRGEPWRALMLFHETLFAGKTGSLFIGASGLLLFTSLILGLWIAWPRRRKWRAAFAVGRWRTIPQRLYGYHRMAGLMIGGVLIILVPSGALLAFSAALEPGLMEAGLVKPPYKAAAVERLPAPAISAQQAFNVAQERFPGAALVAATRPTAESPVFAFRLHQEGEWRRWAGTTAVSISPSDGRVLDVYDPLEAPLGNRILEDVYAVHNGDIGGIAGRIAIMLAGLALPTLYVTGLLSWLRRRRRRPAPPDQFA